MVAASIDVSSAPGKDLPSIARITGVFYLAFFIAGILGTIVVRGQIFDSSIPEDTLSNLSEHEVLARVGIALELGIVLIQAVTALAFYRLFQGIDRFVASSLAVFGMVNAVAILGSAAVLATALEVSEDSSLAVPGGAAATVQLLYVVSDNLWRVAEVFFGLWLIPMGWLVVRSRWMPRVLGWLLVAGGGGYLVSPFVEYLFSNGGIVADLLTLPSIVAELWIMGFLIVFGGRAGLASD